jgi:hypothetical protein
VATVPHLQCTQQRLSRSSHAGHHSGDKRVSAGSQGPAVHMQVVQYTCSIALYCFLHQVLLEPQPLLSIVLLLHRYRSTTPMMPEVMIDLSEVQCGTPAPPPHGHYIVSQVAASLHEARREGRRDLRRSVNACLWSMSSALQPVSVYTAIFVLLIQMESAVCWQQYSSPVGSDCPGCSRLAHRQKAHACCCCAISPSDLSLPAAVKHVLSLH